MRIKWEKEGMKKGRNEERKEGREEGMKKGREGGSWVEVNKVDFIQIREKLILRIRKEVR